MRYFWEIYYYRNAHILFHVEHTASYFYGLLLLVLFVIL